MSGAMAYLPMIFSSMTNWAAVLKIENRNPDRCDMKMSACCVHLGNGDEEKRRRTRLAQTE
jgi:hypothetical protein